MRNRAAEAKSHRALDLDQPARRICTPVDAQPPFGKRGHWRVIAAQLEDARAEI